MAFAGALLVFRPLNSKGAMRMQLVSYALLAVLANALVVAQSDSSSNGELSTAQQIALTAAVGLSGAGFLAWAAAREGPQWLAAMRSIISSESNEAAEAREQRGEEGQEMQRLQMGSRAAAAR